MNFLFIHQNFPGQFCHLASELAEQGHQVVALGINEADKNKPLSDKVKHIRYKLHKSTTKDVHPLASEVETKVIRGEACAAACNQLKGKGFVPDLIYGHPGWGEMLFIKTVYPDVPMVCFQEYFYNEEGYDAGFDMEFAETRDWVKKSSLIMKNAYLHLTLEQADWNVSPTHFQQGTYPDRWKHKFSVIHDGVNVNIAKPSKEKISMKLPDGTVITKKDKVITFINRRLEPYRGFHSFVRSIPHIQRQNPDAHIVMIGGLKGTSYGPKCPEGEWKDMFMKEIKGQYDPALVHFTGSIAHDKFIKLMQMTSCHVYLTYPFVLSWSLLEAMACEAPIVGSNTAPVMELIKNGGNGMITDFFSPTDIAASVTELLTNKPLAQAYGKNARQTILRDYTLDDCLSKQINLIKMITGKNIPF